MIADLFERRARKTQAGHPSTFAAWGSGTTSSGEEISENASLQIAAFYSGVQMIAGDVAQLPLKLIRKQNGVIDVQTGDPRHEMVHDATNEETSSYIFRETLQGHLLTWGNGYAEIERDRRGRPVACYQRRPDRVDPDRRGGKIVYDVTRSDGKTPDVVPRERMLHVPGFSFNGLVGFSPVRMAREALGLAKAAERAGAGFFARGMRFPGAITVKRSLDTSEAREKVRSLIEGEHRGNRNFHKPPILDEEMGWVNIGMPADDAQWLETRVFQVRETARILKIPPYMLGEDEKGQSFKSVAQKNQDYLDRCLMHWIRRWESELNLKLLTEKERRAGFQFVFVLEGFLRAGFSERMEGYSKAIAGGWLTRNEARAFDNLNPLEGLDEPLQPLNMDTPSGAAERSYPARASEAAEAIRGWIREPGVESRAARSLSNRFALADAFRPVLEDAAARLVGREADDIAKEIKKLSTIGDTAFRAWLVAFYERHQEFARTVMGPVLRAYMDAVAAETLNEVDGLTRDELAERLETFEDEYVAAFGTRYTLSQRRQIEALLRKAETPEDAEESVTTRVGEWRETRPQKVSGNEATQAGAAVALLTLGAAGVTRFVVRANAGACPLCQKLNGRVVAIGQPVLSPGDIVDPEDGKTTPLEVKSVRNHPPFHGGGRGCQCGVGQE